MLRRKDGFTLVEMLIAVLIISVLAGAVYATFAQGLRLWQRAGQEGPALEMEFFLEEMISDLRNAMPYGSAVLSGDTDYIQFYKLAPGGGAAEEGNGDRLDVPVRLRYQADPVGKAVMKKEESYFKILAPKTDVPAREKMVASGIGTCRFEYYGRDSHRNVYEWKRRWSESYFPAAIKISLEHEKLPGRKILKIIPLFPGQNAG